MTSTEMPLPASLVVGEVRTPVDLDYRVSRLLAAIKPVENSGWLSEMRPSQALLCCIGSGPWKLPRRELIQKQALQILGNQDLIEKRNELAAFFPLAWQKDLVTMIGRYFHLVARASFDTTAVKANGDVLEMLSGSVNKGLYDFPKVLCMYVRDYLEFPICPRDRHVNKILKEYGIPQNTAVITEAMCRIIGPDSVNEYSRGIFESKSTNPKHELP